MAKPKPSDHSTVIISVIGGVNPGEIQEVAAAAAEVVATAAAGAGAGAGGGGKCEDIIIGGTAHRVVERPRHFAHDYPGLIRCV